MENVTQKTEKAIPGAIKIDEKESLILKYLKFIRLQGQWKNIAFKMLLK